MSDERDPPLPGLWLAEEGPEQDVVVSSRMRLARNVDGYHFRSRFRDGEGERLEQYLHGVLTEVDPSFTYLSLADTPQTLCEVLFERHIVSQEHVTAQHPRGVAYTNDGTTSVMVNEEDHLRIQVFGPGLDLETLVANVDDLDDRIGERVDYSFTPRHGYLTSCPTNTGTGLRVSVMLHLPALSYRPDNSRPGTQGIVKVHNAAQKLGLAVRGMHGESSRAEGDFYQISNQVTLGRPSSQAIGDLLDALPQVLLYEREIRAALLKDDRTRIEDTVWRAWAVLTNARQITSAEALSLLSSLRLGVCVEMIDGVGLGTIHRLMIAMRPGHLQRRAGSELKPEDRDIVRATLIRDTLLGTDGN